MAIGLNSLIEIVVDMYGLNGQVLNVWQYEVASYPVTVAPVQLLEAYWNHIKGTYRGIYPVGWGEVFKSLRVRELNNPVGDYAEYDVPVGERVGTRANPTQAERMPPFAAVGVRLVVGTRATRPGQKRFACLAEGDQISGYVAGTAATSVNSLMTLMVADMALGAPAALTGLDPIVVRKDGNGNVIASQPIEGFLMNQAVTSQNTRKYGRGS